MNRLILVLLTGILLWALLKTGRKILLSLISRFPSLKRTVPLLPGISFIIWIVYAFWLAQVYFSGHEAYPFLEFSLLILLAALLAWFVLRDVAAGLVFSARSQFNLNHRISFGDITGKIIGMGITRLVVRTDSGDTASIPYSRLSGEIVCERAEDTASDYYRIQLRLGKSEPPDQLQASIIREVLCIPWVSFGSDPIVRLKAEDDSSFDFEVLFLSLNARHAARVESVLRSWAESIAPQATA
jgi:small-conductance mechanosensitive channel